jgi:RNA polymerase sigma-70 factor (ECF subfamily)
MPKESPLASLDGFLARYASLAAELHARAQGERWGLPRVAFAEALRRSAEKHFAGARLDAGSDNAPDAAEVRVYLESLHLEDLALACACGEGLEEAWEFFIAHFRQDLRTAASAMLRASGQAGDARAEELADSLYAELYGVRSGTDGRRKSLFEYFHGRSKLATWLRAVLAQRQVDLFRSGSRTVSLEQEKEGAAPRELASRTDPPPADPDREKYMKRFESALTAALAALAPRERLILACYYVDQLRLAEIGRMLREHESTVSRQLERLRRALHDSVTAALQSPIPAVNGRPAQPPLDAAQVELAFEYALEDWPFDLSRALSPRDPLADRQEE